MSAKPANKPNPDSEQVDQTVFSRQIHRFSGLLQRRFAKRARPDLDAEAGLAGEFSAGVDLAGLRALFDGASGLLNGGLPPLAQVITRVEIGADTSATVDLFVPRGEGPHPVLVYLHGGAWVAGSPASHRKLTARIAAEGFLVVSVDYRLAPEHPFPAGLEDCIDAVYWTASSVADYGGDPARIAIGGDSAGANLAAATVGVLSERLSAPKLAAAVLIYGVFDMSDMGNAMANRFIHQAYLPGPLSGRLADPRVSPIHIARKLPPSFVVIGTQDTLLPQSQRLREMLEAAGTPHLYLEARNMPHGFMQMEFLGGVRRIVSQMSEFLDSHMVDTRATRWRRTRMSLFRRFVKKVGRLIRPGG